ncbi:hypothetical protein FISHEDRAFT_62912 [Fistulina hepatica ATCC 64428]|uniref:Uncharacterized protein n=1 Tax=Fistulina hepatica ATCC 64428 TaxID=1128425 RepID=A0A0D6ZZ83_9AGAR|nr:hypothetical protein FISHEDRAFT_62912 [Fistulina hepatica ATCC 64428]
MSHLQSHYLSKKCWTQRLPLEGCKDDLKFWDALRKLRNEMPLTHQRKACKLKGRDCIFRIRQRSDENVQPVCYTSYYTALSLWSLISNWKTGRIRRTGQVQKWKAVSGRACPKTSGKNDVNWITFSVILTALSCVPLKMLAGPAMVDPVATSHEARQARARTQTTRLLTTNSGSFPRHEVSACMIPWTRPSLSPNRHPTMGARTPHRMKRIKNAVQYERQPAQRDKRCRERLLRRIRRRCVEVVVQ